MILKKAQMQFQDLELNYCGSLGPSSYFDLQCPAQIQTSGMTFIPSSGAMLYQGKQFECDAL